MRFGILLLLAISAAVGWMGRGGFGHSLVVLGLGFYGLPILLGVAVLWGLGRYFGWNSLRSFGRGVCAVVSLLYVFGLGSLLFGLMFDRYDVHNVRVFCDEIFVAAKNRAIPETGTYNSLVEWLHDRRVPRLIFLRPDQLYYTSTTCTYYRDNDMLDPGETYRLENLVER